MKKTYKIGQVAERLGVDNGNIYSYIYNAIPEKFQPEKSWDRSQGQLTFEFTEKDINVIRFAISLKKENTYKQVKEILSKKTYSEIEGSIQASVEKVDVMDDSKEPNVNLINIEDKEGQLLVSSREVAENFEKQHKHIMESIRNLETSIENSTHLFIPSQYKDSYSRNQNEYLLTRDGFSLLVMGFTGQKALKWKLKYIEAFNRMEKRLKEGSLPSDLSPELQFMINTEMKLREQGKEIQSIKDTINIVPDSNWRNKVNDIFNNIGFKTGEYAEYRNESYVLLEDRARCDLDTRLKNAKERALNNGVPYSKVKALNYLDIISQDNKLIEIYLSIVKDFSIKYL